jgi:hypothetical protein
VVNDPASPNIATEKYDGTTWDTNSNPLNTARGGPAGAGTQTAALAIGGYDGSPNRSNRRI